MRKENPRSEEEEGKEEKLKDKREIFSLLKFKKILFIEKKKLN